MASNTSFGAVPLYEPKCVSVGRSDGFDFSVSLAGNKSVWPRREAWPSTPKPSLGIFFPFVLNALRLVGGKGGLAGCVGYVCTTMAILGVTVLCNTSAVAAPQNCQSISGNSAFDQSSAIQCRINAMTPGGGSVFLPAGTIYAQGLALTNDVTLVGQGEDATILALPAGATAPYLVASSTYIAGDPWVNMYGGVRDLTLDGSRASTVRALLIIQAWRFSVARCGVRNSPLHGIMMTDYYMSGSGDTVRTCHFDNNKGAGFYAQSVHDVIADGTVEDSEFNANGSAGFYQIHLERAAGFHILNNQTYGSPVGELFASQAAVMEICGNNFDGTSNAATTVNINTGGWGAVSISGNAFHTQSQRNQQKLLSINSTVAGGATVSGNTFYSVYAYSASIAVIGAHARAVTESGNSYEPAMLNATLPAPLKAGFDD